MSLHRRLAKLESVAPQPTDPILILYQIFGVDGTSRPGPAVSVGVGQIEPASGEAEGDFLRRAYAMHFAQKLPHQMTEEELEIALAAADAEIAMENADEGPSVNQAAQTQIEPNSQTIPHEAK